MVPRLEGAETKGGKGVEVLRNEQISRAYQCCLVHDSSEWRECDLGQLKPSHLPFIMADTMPKNLAVYEAPKQDTDGAPALEATRGIGRSSAQMGMSLGPVLSL